MILLVIIISRKHEGNLSSTDMFNEFPHARPRYTTTTKYLT
jgi:hypothetical protein